MDTYNKTHLTIAGAVAVISILIGILGWWFMNSTLLMTIAVMPLGATAIAFNHDLAMERIVNHHLDRKYYAFARGTYVLVGTGFIVAGIIILVGR